MLGSYRENFHRGDHAGRELRNALFARMQTEYAQSDVEVFDVGSGGDVSSDYPDDSARLAQAVRNDPGARGILVCGSGAGVCITANKFTGVRAVQVYTPEAAALCVQHNNANVICVAGRTVELDKAMAIVEAWRTAQFEGDRHARRLGKIAAVEKGVRTTAAVEELLEIVDEEGLVDEVLGALAETAAPPADTEAAKSRLMTLADACKLPAGQNPGAYLGAFLSAFGGGLRPGIRRRGH